MCGDLREYVQGALFRGIFGGGYFFTGKYQKGIFEKDCLGRVFRSHCRTTSLYT